VEEVSRQGGGRWKVNGLRAGALKVDRLGWAWGCKGDVVGCGGNHGGSPGVCIARKAISDQGIGEFGKHPPYPMVTWLVEEIQSWVIGNVNHWLVWVS